MTGDILKGISAILWPVVVAGALLGFRTEVRTLLRRLRRVSKGAAEFDDARLAVQLTGTSIEQALRCDSKRCARTKFYCGSRSSSSSGVDDTSCR